ncbi:A/G-specific adenine glycosylase [soil metagenome]
MTSAPAAPPTAFADQGAAFRRKLLGWYREHGRDLPWRRTSDPYAILVSELMLQQTQVATVLTYYNAWLARFPDFAALAAANESDVLHAWQGLGYYARARNLRATAKAVVAQHGGVFPRAIEQSRKLPGVGRYTANAVATFAFGSAVPIVEANTARLYARLTNLQLRVDSAAGQQQLWDFAATLLPSRDAAAHNSALMDLGALICVSGRPKCDVCPVRAFCTAEDPVRLPLKATRTSLKLLTEHHGFSIREGRVVLERAQHRWRGMWILPRVTSLQSAKPPLYSADFPFTHHRITLRVCEDADRGKSAGKEHRSFAVGELDSIPMPSPHRRALNALLQQHTAPTN